MPDFTRTVPVKKALSPETLLAYEMNGEQLPVKHGFPLRAVVPGWAGDSWVKWVTDITVLDKDHDGFFMKTAYRYPVEPIAPGTALDPAQMRPLESIRPKSVIARQNALWTLSRRKAAGCFEPAEIGPWLLQTCGALEEAHKGAITHGDLSAANIYVQNNGRLLLANFGVLFTHRGAPLLIGIGFFTLLGAGAMFYWLDPKIDNYWDGLWLAFVTGTTVGYGDVIPSTAASRVFAALMVLVGVSLMTLFTANVVSFFIGRDELELRRALHRDIGQLRNQVERLLGAEELRIHKDLHAEVKLLREEVQALREALAKARDA